MGEPHRSWVAWGIAMILANGAMVAAAAAAEAARQMREEEEEMTSYSPKDLAEDWEFKILRSNSRVFQKPGRLRAILDEEARGGWVLVEKFDDTRIRLKRRASLKVAADDIASGYDPYRTQIEANVPGWIIAALIVGGVIGGLILIVGFSS